MNRVKLHRVISSPAFNLVLTGLLLAGLFSLHFLLHAWFKFYGDGDIPPSAHWSNEVWLILTILILAVYYLAYRQLLHYFKLKLVIIFSLIFSVIFLLIHPFASADVWLYIFYPKILLFYHQNPYLVPLQNFSSDILYQSGYVIKAWLPNPLAYGPTWLILSSLFTFWSLKSVALAVFSFKLMATFFFFACAFLLYKILSIIKPEQKVLGTSLWLWSPLVLLEIVNNAHNDIVMIFFFLLAIYLLVKKKYFWVMPILVVSVLVKYLNVIFLPLFLIYLWQNWGKIRKKDFCWSLGLSAVVLFLLWLPWWSGFRTLNGLILFDHIYNFKGISLVGLFGYHGSHHWPPESPSDVSAMFLSRLVSQLIFLCFYLLMLWRSWRRTLVVNDLFKNIILIFGFYLLTASFYLQTWYFVLPLAVMLLIKGWPNRWLILVTAIGLFNYFYMFVDLTIVFLLFIALDFWRQHFFPKNNRYARTADQRNK